MQHLAPGQRSRLSCRRFRSQPLPPQPCAALREKSCVRCRCGHCSSPAAALGCRAGRPVVT